MSNKNVSDPKVVRIPKRKKLVKKQAFFFYDAGIDRPKLFSDLDEPDGATYRVEHLEYNSRRYLHVFVQKAGAKQPPTGARSVYIPITIAAQIAELLKEKLPAYIDRPKRGLAVTGYFILATQNKQPSRFIVYSDMMFSSLRDAAKYVPNEGASKLWKIFKVTYDRSCFTTAHDIHTFTKVVGVEYKAGWSGGKWKKPKTLVLPEQG